eukprot:2238007-Amphidinium_carterae.1
MSEESFELQSDDGSENYSFGAASTGLLEAAASGEKTQVEIKLSTAVESSLSRRGRRRFRELQANSSAKIRFDRARAVLKIIGTEPEILAVQRKLECLGGVRKRVAQRSMLLSEVVPTAVWCELMRTRLDENPEQSVLQLMQLQSGCRIHIERSLQEVRLFGPDENTRHGLELIEEFSARCVEAAIPSKPDSMPDSVVKAVTDAFQVTVNVEMRQVMVYGLKDAVRKARHEVESYLQSGILSLDASVDTDVESDDGASSSFSSSVATWTECPEPSSPAGSDRSNAFAAEGAHSSAESALPNKPFLATAQPNLVLVQMTGCYLPATTQPMVPMAPMFQAVLVPANMVFAPVPLQGAVMPQMACMAGMHGSPR